jgi:anti-sigma B factor antagonist
MDNRNKVVLDFAGVDWINSTGLGMLIAANGLLRDIDGEMKLAAVNDSVSGLLKMNKLHLVFDIYPTVENAVASMN